MRTPGGAIRISFLGAYLVFGFGCESKLPEGALVLTEKPSIGATAERPQTILDERYPPGSRVVVAVPPYRPSDVRLLSKGLIAAGEPVVAPSGERVFFTGKARSTDDWQIYEARLWGGWPKQRTTVAGGAMNPAVNASGNLVFSSSVPRAGQEWTAAEPAALYEQAQGGLPRRLTFGASTAAEPTMLADGRVLYVSAHPPSKPGDPLSLGLFTINNDGTEVTAFALEGDGAAIVRRPRELPDGRVAFLGRASEERTSLECAKTVWKAKPFASRQPLLGCRRCYAVEPDGAGGLLLCLDKGGVRDRSVEGGGAVFHMASDSKDIGEALFQEPGWSVTEAAAMRPHEKPMGHISVMAPSQQSGTILCLNANFTRGSKQEAEAAAKSVKIRVLMRLSTGEARALGEVELAADGSFMAEVPADKPLGFEALDAAGHVLRRMAPSLWVRAGENRSCIGCHEPPNRSPRNVRPLAVAKPPAVFLAKSQEQRAKGHDEDAKAEIRKPNRSVEGGESR